MEITCTRTTSVVVTYAGTLRRVVIVIDGMTGRMVIVKDPHVCVSARAERQLLCRSKRSAGLQNNLANI